MSFLLTMRRFNITFPFAVLLVLLTQPLTVQGLPVGNPQTDGTLRRIHVPILMYHYVSELPEDADQLRTDLTVTPDDFHEQMQFLHDQGYSTISLYELDAALQTGIALPPRPIVLTFDDGYIDHYTNVFPILKNYGFTATFFIITARLDSNHAAYISWDQVTLMAQAGMSMEAHTKTHQDLRERDYDFLVYEILGSIESLEAHTSVPVQMFAYPGGRYDQQTLEVLAASPVRLAVTTQPGTLHTTDNRLELPRLRISHTTGVQGLKHMLETF